jgi:plasmid stability protein
MPAILIKGVPAELHRQLKEDAAQHHRSMARHALALIEEGLAGAQDLAFPHPEKPRRPFTRTVLSRAIKEGRT